MSNFRTIDRGTGFLLPPSVDEWLPEQHLARFVVEIVDATGFARAEWRLSRLGFEVLSPRLLMSTVLRLRDGRVFEPQAGAGDVRFGGVPF